MDTVQFVENVYLSPGDDANTTLDDDGEHTIIMLYHGGMLTNPHHSCGCQDDVTTFQLIKHGT